MPCVFKTAWSYMIDLKLCSACGGLLQLGVVLVTYIARGAFIKRRQISNQKNEDCQYQMTKLFISVSTRRHSLLFY